MNSNKCDNFDIKSKSPKESEIETRYLVMPYDANPLGTAFGGIILSWIDMVAGMTAKKHCGREAVTASLDSVSFDAPVYVGDHIILKSCVNYVGNTSLEIGVKVIKEDPISCEKINTTTAYLTFVALDVNNKPTKVPELIITTDDEKRRYENAKLRVLARKELRKRLSKKD